MWYQCLLLYSLTEGWKATTTISRMKQASSCIILYQVKSNPSTSSFLMHTPLLEKADQHPIRHSPAKWSPVTLCTGWHVRWVCWETLRTFLWFMLFFSPFQHRLSSNKLNHYHLSYREGFSEYSWMNTNKAHMQKHPTVWSNTFERLLELGGGEWGAGKSSVSCHTKCLLVLSTNR